MLIRDKYVKGLVDLIAPGLLFYEVANALRYNPRFGVEEVKNALKALEKLGISLYDFEGQLRDTSIELAYRFGITVYDAAYVALAVIQDAVLYTADKEVVAKTSLENIKHLSEIVHL